MNLQLGKYKMDVLDLIKTEHRQVASLFSEIESTDHTHKLYECFNQLYNSLSINAEVKSQIFYPAIRSCQGAEQLVDAAQKEHEEIKQMLEELESFSPTSAEFKQKILELKQVVQRHTQEEENRVFSQVRECMNQKQREQLASEFQAVKSKLQSEMSFV